MARKDKLKGVDIRQLVTLANRGGQKAAAAKYGVSQGTISRILKANGYTQRIVYVKKEQTS